MHFYGRLEPHVYFCVINFAVWLVRIIYHVITTFCRSLAKSTTIKCMTSATLVDLYAPSGVSILNVTRIHNRWLRNRFEKHSALEGSSNDTTWVSNHNLY